MTQESEKTLTNELSDQDRLIYEWVALELSGLPQDFIDRKKERLMQQYGYELYSETMCVIINRLTQLPQDIPAWERALGRNQTPQDKPTDSNSL